MPSFNQSYSFSHPTIVLPPSQLTHPFDYQPCHTPRNVPSFSKGSNLGKPSPMAASPCGQKAQTPSSMVKNLKRSRDEAASNLTDDQDYFTSSSSSPILAPENEDEWQYGEGMVLIKPNGFIIDASSQTGTWAEEKAAEEQQERAHQQVAAERPILRNAKLQRLDQSAPSAEETVYTSAASNPPQSSTEPTVDDFTIHLGIGWNRISDDEHIQAAARGWAKFIEHNYPVTSPVIRLESRGLNSYLVEATEGFFLFGEDLKQGRLVSKDFVKTVQNLQVRPPIFDGSDVLAARSDMPMIDERPILEVPPVEITNERFQNTVPNTMDVDMDLNC